MKTNELKPNNKVNDLVVVITHLEAPGQGSNGTLYQEGIVSDEEGQVAITLWEDHVDKYKAGDKILLKTGWCKEFPKDSGDLQVSTGKFGKIELIPPIKEE